MEMRFFRCEVCGQIVAIVKGTGVPVVCCGRPMKELVRERPTLPRRSTFPCTA